MGRRTATVALAALLLGALSLASPQTALTKDTSGGGAQQTSPDNTKMNKQDRSKEAVTADQQKNTQSDRELTKTIRDAITKDKSLSTYAHNVKVITRDGMVTLKGTVRTPDEKTAVEKIATDAVGKDKVTNKLTVAPKKAKGDKKQTTKGDTGTKDTTDTKGDTGSNK